MGSPRSVRPSPPDRPHTPPYTPARHKFALSRSPSPDGTVWPHETSSPDKKIVKVVADYVVEVVELPDADADALADVELVYPESSEEPLSDTDDDGEDDDDDGRAVYRGDPAAAGSCSTHDDDEEEEDSSNPALVWNMPDLRMDEKQERTFYRLRRQRRAAWLKNLPVFKRSHSLRVQSELGDVDPDTLDCPDSKSFVGRPRKRTRGPDDSDVDFEQLSRSLAATGIHIDLPRRAGALLGSQTGAGL